MKRFASLALAVLFLGLALTGCGQRSVGPQKQPDVTELADTMLAATTLTDELMEISPEVIANLYEVDSDEIEAFRVYASTGGSTAEEIAVFKATKQESVSYIETMINIRLADLTFNFENYVPEEVFKIEKAEILKNGLYVALVIADDPQPAKQTFEKAF